MKTLPRTAAAIGVFILTFVTVFGCFSGLTIVALYCPGMCGAFTFIIFAPAFGLFAVLAMAAGLWASSRAHHAYVRKT